MANAFKGDAVLVRACGDITAMFYELDPPQRYSHEGIMTKNRVEVTQSTGSKKYLENHYNGAFGQPTDGFEEQALRYLWPGLHTSSIQHAFVGGDDATTDPDGKIQDVRGFARGRARCQGDANIIYPRVMKPAPEYEVATRPVLHAIADAAKLVDSHYRFSLYSDATILGNIDPDAPDWSRATGNRQPGQATVCSGLLRQAMVGAGAAPDSDTLLPRPGDKRGDAPAGLFFYDEDERRAAAHALYSHTHNEVQHRLALLEGEVLDAIDDNWWWVVPVATTIPLGIVALTEAGDTAELLEFVTDAPDDIANQVVNCFASDDCAESAKDHQKWRFPGTGIAISPDDTLDHYDSPETGGTYGYHEPIIYRGKRHQPTFEWRAAAGSRTLRGRVLNGDTGQAQPAALVEVLGLGEPATVTGANGDFSIPAVPGPNIQVHASKFIGVEGDGALYEGTACYRPDPNAADPDGSESLQRVDCNDFTSALDPVGVLHDTVEVVLRPPPSEYRRVTLTGFAQITDCDCCGPTTCPDRSSAQVFAECRVGPDEPSALIVIGQNELCADEVGARLRMTCTLEDNNSVHVTGDATLFESNEDSCGGSEAEHTRDFDVVVAEDETRGFSIGGTLSNDGSCNFVAQFDCDDRVEFSNLQLVNERAE